MDLLIRILMLLFLLWWFFTQFIPYIMDFIFVEKNGLLSAFIFYLLGMI
jgi:hypothetical protein